ncbi:hypothetical protein ABG067_007745 [Albugo candida]
MDLNNILTTNSKNNNNNNDSNNKKSQNLDHLYAHANCQWTIDRDIKLMEGMIDEDPTKMKYKERNIAWKRIMEAVNLVDKDVKEPLSLRTIHQRCKILVNDYVARDKKGANESGGNEKYGKLDRLINDYKSRSDEKEKKETEEKRQKEEKKNKDADTQSVVLERLESMGPPVEKRRKEKGSSAIKKRKTRGDAEGDAIEKYVEDAPVVFNDTNVLQSLQEELQGLLNENEEAKKENRQLVANMKSFEKKQDELKKEVQSLRDDMKEIKQMLKTLLGGRPTVEEHQTYG